MEESLTDKALFTNTVFSSNAKSKKYKKKKSKEDKIANKKNIDKSFDTMSYKVMFGDESSSPGRGLSGGAVPKNKTSGALSASILQVEPKMLNAETELRRIFGSKVVNSLGRSFQTGPSRQGRGGRRGNHNHRKTILVSPLDHWPRWNGSFSMEYLETKDQYHYFRYVYLFFPLEF